MLYCFSMQLFGIQYEQQHSRILGGVFMEFESPNSQLPIDKRSASMTTAAVVLSMIAVCTICCVYISFICGILGIILALLSKGGESTMSPNARTALNVSITAIVLTIMLLAGSFITLILQYGSIEEFWRVYMEMVKTYSAGMT